MIRWLYLDLNSFFASCEQQERPEFRCKPVAVIPLEADSTAVLAASYEAKAYGVKTGTKVGDAKRMCPGIRFVLGDHKRYVEYHNRILKAVETCAPIERVASIDEVVIRLAANQRSHAEAMKLAQTIKQTIARDVGECLTSSIGLASNQFLAKVAADMQKPNGLTLLPQESLPHALWRLKLQDLPGIGPRMEQRLHRAGIFDVKTLTSLSALRMRSVWGGVHGARMYLQLQGQEVPYLESERQSIGHQHVLEPELRNATGGYDVLSRLLIKGAERLRRIEYYCRYLSVQVKFTAHQGYFEKSTRFRETQDTSFLLNCLKQLWTDAPTLRPLRVGIMLGGLIPANFHQLDFFTTPKPEGAMKAVDAINQKFGRGTISFGLSQALKRTLDKDKIAFQRVPQAGEV